MKRNQKDRIYRAVYEFLATYSRGYRGLLPCFSDLEMTYRGPFLLYKDVHTLLTLFSTRYVPRISLTYNLILSE